LSTIFLDTPIEYLKGVGPQKADTLKKEIQVFTFGDLLTYFPYRYIDKTKFHTIAEIQGDENFVQIKGSIISVEMLGKERGKRMVATLKDETGTLELVWFKGIKWIASSIKLHEKIIVFGRPSVFNKSIQISHPELEPINVNVQVQLSKFEPMYNSSEKMKLKVVEPLRSLFKDEVRLVGKALGMPDELLNRHPFPGPGLGIRILGDVTEEKVRIIQEVDAIYIDGLKQHGLYDKVWQAGAILLPVKSVGVMGDERTYEQVVALRAVESTDGMTADWVHLPYTFLADISNSIINKVRGVNRVVYDISSKPPATIEWE
jgi:hypothetical protein